MLTRLLTLAAGLLLAPAAWAQGGSFAATQRIELPFFAYVGSLPQRPSLDDSLTRRAYARNRVRTVVKLQHPLLPTAPPDTIEYRELDQYGNTTLLLRPGYQRLIYRYDAQQRLVEVREPASRRRPVEQRQVYDPGQQLYRSYRGVPGQPATLVQTVRQRQRGDTALTVAEFSLPLQLGPDTITRVELRRFPRGRDTVRIDMLAFNAAGRRVDYFGVYTIRRRGLAVETGDVSFAAALQAHGAPVQQRRSQGLADEAITAQLYRQWRPEYQPRQYNFYDAHGRLSSSETLKHGGRPLIAIQNKQLPTIKTRTLGGLASQMVYERDKDGRLLRQEDRVFGGEPPVPPQRTYYTEYRYNGQGLLEAETNNRGGSQLLQYDYHYTRY
jgi:hypothetical protein